MARPTRRPAFLGSTAIVGVGYTPLSKRSGRSVLALATEACRNAIADAGLTPRDVDGIASFRFMEDSVPTSAVATTLGLDPSNYLLDSALGGQAPCYLVMHAAMAVHAGLADTVVVYRALNGRSGARVGTNRVPGPATDFRYSVGFSAYAQFIAMWARRYLIDSGATPDDLAECAIAQREWAAMNERAMLRTPLTREAYYAAPWVADPFRVPDCTIEVDGACAVVVTSLERARDLAHRPAVIESAAYVAGRGPGLDMGDALLWPDMSRNFTSIIADDLWGAAGIGPDDVDIAEIYDCFTTSALIGMEGLGLAPRGGAGELIRSGATRPGGRLPVNTNGGLLSEGYLHGMNTVAEAVLQMQGRCGERTVTDAETCVVTSGALTDGSALVLSKG
jgi:acetyl-CoA acetyltransferase